MNLQFPSEIAVGPQSPRRPVWESGFLPRDLPISWASYLVLASTGTLGVVSESKNSSPGPTSELPWARDLIKVSEPISSSVKGSNNNHFTQLLKGLNEIMHTKY